MTTAFAPRYNVPYATAFDSVGVVSPGAQLFFYETGTSTPVNTYSNSALTIPNTNPVVANGAGLFGNIFLTPGQQYKVVLEDSTGDQIWTADPVYGAASSGSYIPAALYGCSASSSDNTAAMNAALIAGAAANLPVGLEGLTLKFLGTLTWDQSHTGIDLQGGVMDFTGISASPAMAPMTTWTDPNSMTGANNRFPMKNGLIIGPNNGPGYSCITPVAKIISTVPWITGMIFQNLGVSGFDVFFDIVSGVVFPTFKDVYFGSDSLGHNSGWFLRSMGNVNSGEGLHVEHCQAINCTGFFLEQVQNDNLDMAIDGISSMDNITYLAVNGTLGGSPGAGINGKLSFFSPHWESWQSTAYTVWCGANGTIRVFGANEVRANPVTHVLYRSDATGLGGGIIIRDHNLNGTNNYPNGIMCDGSGNFELSMKENGSTMEVAASLASNRVPDYTLAAGTGQNNWTGSPTTSNSSPPSGATKYYILNSTNVTAFSTPCLPGQAIAAQAMLEFTSPGAGDVYFCSLGYYDSGDQMIGSLYSIAIGSAITNWTLQQLIIPNRAPPGTVVAKLLFNYVPNGGGATCKFGLPQVIIT